MVLDPERADAMLQLCFLAAEKPKPQESLPYIETVLYGKPEVHSRTNGVFLGAGMQPLPSTFELTLEDLAGLKELCDVIRLQAREAVPSHVRAL